MTPEVPPSGTPTPEPRFEDDPEWQRLQARFIEPETDNRDERLFIRFATASEMRDIEARYEQT